MTDTQLDALDKLIAAVEAGEFDGQPAKYNAFARVRYYCKQRYAMQGRGYLR